MTPQQQEFFPGGMDKLPGDLWDEGLDGQGLKGRSALRPSIGRRLRSESAGREGKTKIGTRNAGWKAIEKVPPGQM
jgi:hypothetical protein